MAEESLPAPAAMAEESLPAPAAMAEEPPSSLPLAAAPKHCTTCLFCGLGNTIRATYCIRCKCCVLPTRDSKHRPINWTLYAFGSSALHSKNTTRIGLTSALERPRNVENTAVYIGDSEQKALFAHYREGGRKFCVWTREGESTTVHLSDWDGDDGPKRDMFNAAVHQILTATDTFSDIAFYHDATDGGQAQGQDRAETKANAQTKTPGNYAGIAPCRQAEDESQAQGQGEAPTNPGGRTETPGQNPTASQVLPQVEAGVDREGQITFSIQLQHGCLNSVFVRAGLKHGTSCNSTQE